MLVATDVTRYLEFKLVDGRWLFSFRRVTVDPKSAGAK